MNKSVHTKTFNSGNSVAVRLPKGFDIPAGTEVELSRTGDQVVIRLLQDKAEARRELRKMLDTLRTLPKPPYVEKREPFEFPDREGL